MNGLNKKYYDIANLMNTGLIIYFEGECNKKFYANFDFFKKHTLLNGNSCSNIIKKAGNNNNCIGVIDGDFDDSKIDDKIFKIDFYSIENIVVIYHKLFNELKKEFLHPFFSNHKIIRKHIQVELGNYNQSFKLKFGNLIDNKYHEYINKKINNEDDYVKYMNLKKVVDKFSIYKINCRNTNKEDKNIYRKYIETLFDYMNNCNINVLFSNSEFSRIKLFFDNFYNN